MFKQNEFDKVLDQAVAGLRAAEPTSVEAEAAADRVWKNLSVEASASEPADSGARIAGCADVQSLLPAYRAGKLSQAREWLVQDHLRDCPQCRNASRADGRVIAMPWREGVNTGRPKMTAARKYAWAAALLVTAGTSAYLFRDSFLPAPAGDRATLAWSSGPVYLVSDDGQKPLPVNAGIGEREWVRTPSGSRAMLKLRDGSLVELGERAEMTVAMNRKDTTVNLERGSIIIQAAKRRTGHLNVATTDTSISVTGTVFAVDRGTKGTRVGVLEGEVQVDTRGRHISLQAGDQTTSHPSVQPLAVKEQVAWSKDFEQHVKLLAEMQAIAKEIRQIPLPGLRYQSRLLGALPAGTVVFVSVPNIGEQLAQARQIFVERIQQSEALREWYEKHGGDKQQQHLNQLTDFVRGGATYLGDEVVMAAAHDGTGKTRFAVVAEVQKQGLREYIDAELQRMNVKERPQMLITEKLAVFAPDAEALSAFSGAGGLAGQPFGRKISEALRDGASVLFCADMQRLAPTTGAKNDVLKTLGADDVEYLVVAQRDYNDQAETRATLNFAGPRHGVASWLAAPGPIGSLDFVSAHPTVAAAFVIKDPAKMIDDLFAAAGGVSESFREAESKIGVRLRDDLAASLGNDVTIAVDGQVIPPAWKVIVEVKDPARVREVIERVVGEFNRSDSAQKAGELKLTEQPSGQQMAYELRLDKANVEMHFAFVDGYLVMTANAEGMNRALRAKDSGWRLTRSWEFQRLLPPDKQTNFSAIIYHDFTRIADVVRDAATAAGNITPDQQQAVSKLAGATKPGLIFAYGLENSIQVASTAGFFGLTLDQVMGSAGIAGILDHTPLKQEHAARRSRSD
jgi:hypothetical protein